MNLTLSKNGIKKRTKKECQNTQMTLFLHLEYMLSIRRIYILKYIYIYICEYSWIFNGNFITSLVD